MLQKLFIAYFKFGALCCIIVLLLVHDMGSQSQGGWEWIVQCRRAFNLPCKCCELRGWV